MRTKQYFARRTVSIWKWYLYILSVLLVPSLQCLAESGINLVVVDRVEQFNELDRHFLGFNSPMGMAGRTKGNYTSPSLMNGAKKLPVHALRYPGGTVGNFFDWGAETLFTDFIAKVGKEKMINLDKLDRERNEGQLTHVDLDSFYEACNILDARRFIVLNLLAYKAEEVSRIVDSVKRKYKAPVYWELGNELSYRNYEKKYKVPGGWGVDKYLAKASTVASYIKAKYPDDRVGINVSEMVLAPGASTHTRDKIRRRGMLWDTNVSSISDADAVIVHPYVFLRERGYAALKKERVSADELTGLGERDGIRWRWLFSSAQEIPKMYMERLSKRFPGKSIWLTELGVLAEEVAGNQSGAIYRLLFNVAYFSSWARYYPQLEAFLYHGLFYGKSPSAVLYKDLSYTANGLAFAFIGALLDGATELAMPEFSSVPAYNGLGYTPDQQVRALSGVYVHTAKGDRLLLVNSGAKEIDIKFPISKGSIIEYGGGADLTVDPGEILSLSDLPSRTFSNEIIKVKPFSVMLIKAASC